MDKYRGDPEIASDDLVGFFAYAVIHIYRKKRLEEKAVLNILGKRDNGNLSQDIFDKQVTLWY
jgi:hypothetical protein